MIREHLKWLIAVGVLVLWAVGLRGAIWWHAGRHPENATDDADQERQEAGATALVAELEPPTSVVGAADAERLDVRDVVALLRAGRTAEIGNALARAQELFERDPRKEQLVEALFEGMRFVRPEDVRRLDEWVAADSTSFVPFVARALATMEVARKEPSPRREREEYRLARLDLERAVALRPAAVVTYGRLIRVAVAEGSPSPKELLARAIAICPTCLGPRVSYMLTLRPQWGGSREARVAFAEESQKNVSENPRLRSLLGYADLDDCIELTRARRYAEAVTACDRAIAVYPTAPFWVAKAKALHFLGKYAESAEAASNALAERPFSEDALVARARAHVNLDDRKAAAEDVKLALQLAPRNGAAGEIWSLLLAKLEWVAEEALAAKNPQRALDAYDLVLRLAPSHPKFRDAREHVRARFGLSPSHGSSG